MTTTEPRIALDTQALPIAPAASWETECLNCGSELGGPFCSHCGQRAVPPDPKLRELAGDAFVEFSGWDGKFAETIRALLWRPGELTRQFIAGRRVRFISPVRLYLAMSFVYFVIAAAAPELAPGTGVSAPGINVGVTNTPDRPGAPARASAAMSDARAGLLTPAERDSALASLQKAPRLVRPIIKRVIEDPVGFKRGMFETMPRVLFALLPVLAAIVSLFYRRRNYPEHLYFALHLSAFTFLALALGELAKFTHVSTLATAVGAVATLWIPAYTVLALRRVYGDSLGKTVAKTVGIGALYLVASGVAMFCLIYWAAVST